MSQKHLGGLVLALVLFGFFFLLYAAYQQDTAAIEKGGIAILLPDTIAPMFRVGSVKQGRKEISLWVFEFEDKRCLWAVYTKNSGLTCWDKK